LSPSLFYSSHPTPSRFFFSFFLNDTPPPEIYPLSLHDALPISPPPCAPNSRRRSAPSERRQLAEVMSQHLAARIGGNYTRCKVRSEEHTSELQSLTKLVCRLLL